MIVLVVVVCAVPDVRTGVKDSLPFLTAIGIIELLFISRIVHALRKKRLVSGTSDIMIIVWLVLLAWELATTKTGTLGIMLYPSPENVFDVYVQYGGQMVENALFSLRILAYGFLGGMAVGIILGLVVGWIPRLLNTFYPIARVLAPIPPMIYAPYLIVLMPTFSSASIMLIAVLIFMFTFLEIVSKVGNINRRIIDSARSMNLSTPAIIFRILLPYSLPGIVNSLKINMTMAFMMLMFAETMATSRGLGCWVINNNNYANYTNVVAGFIEIGIVVVLLNWIIGIIQDKTIKWR
jgi:NitT/TauT family transport system permease protein